MKNGKAAVKPSLLVALLLGVLMTAFWPTPVEATRDGLATARVRAVFNGMSSATVRSLLGAPTVERPPGWMHDKDHVIHDRRPWQKIYVYQLISPEVGALKVTITFIHDRVSQLAVSQPILWGLAEKPLYGFIYESFWGTRHF